MQHQTKGIVIKVTRVNSSDMYCTFLTKDIGIVTVYIKNARRIKNNVSATTDMYCYSDLVFFKHKDTYKLDQASPLDVFFPLREDLEKTSLAQYFCDLVQQTCQHEQHTEDVLRLLLMAFKHLANGDVPKSQIKAIIELRLMCITGYMPQIVACNVCAEYSSERMYFNLIKGNIMCSSCGKRSQGDVEANFTILAALRHITYSQPLKLFKFTLDEENINYLTKITEDYVMAHINKQFKTLDFYYSVTKFTI